MQWLAVFFLLWFAAPAAAQPANTTITGCVYNATLPTVVDLSYITSQCDAQGSMRVATSPTRITCVTPTITANTYTQYFEVGGLMTFGLAFGQKTSGVIQTVSVTTKQKQASTSLRLYLFNANPSNSTWTDRVVPAINALDSNKVKAVVDLTDSFTDLGAHTIWTKSALGISYAASTSTVFGVLVATTNLVAFGTTSDLEVCLHTFGD